MFACENISCIKGNSQIFGQLGFCLQRESLLLLKGPNGSGKTSLLRILSGLMQPANGTITWEGAPIANNDVFKRELMFIGHKSGVKTDCTVKENIAFWGKLYGTEQLVPAAIKFFDLTMFRDMPASQLSAGWQRRVALARLIVVPCRLWLLDEPTNFLDEDAVILMANLIETRVKQGGIVVIASHIMNSAIPAHTLMMADYQP